MDRRKFIKGLLTAGTVVAAAPLVKLLPESHSVLSAGTYTNWAANVHPYSAYELMSIEKMLDMVYKPYTENGVMIAQTKYSWWAEDEVVKIKYPRWFKNL